MIESDDLAMMVSSDDLAMIVVSEKMSYYFPENFKISRNFLIFVSFMLASNDGFW